MPIAREDSTFMKFEISRYYWRDVTRRRSPASYWPGTPTLWRRSRKMRYTARCGGRAAMWTDRGFVVISRIETSVGAFSRDVRCAMCVRCGETSV